MRQIIQDVALSDTNFPALLREIPFPPDKLHVWGKIPERGNFLSIVGTRKCTAYGEEIVRKIIAGLAPHHFVIVSGLAIGIDTVAHKASIENSVPTVAVLGSGLSPSVLYPMRNLPLAEEIVRRGGAVVSEYDTDMKATLWSFPQRNRIISGMCPATLVVEAPEKSGARITARFALDQNRDVLAVPGSIFAPNSYSTNRLIKDGAYLIENAEDILRIYGIETENAHAAEIDLSADEKKIFDELKEPMYIDSIIRNSKIPAATLSATIGLMEIRGIIKKIGNEYVRNV